MIVQIRKNITGTEYWDTEKKKTIFVPKGQQPDFKVEDNPKSMITPEGDKKPEILTKHLNVPETNQEVLEPDGNTEENLADESITNPVPDDQSSELDSMTIKQLREYAKENNINIPSALKTKGDIIALISDYE